MSTDITRRGFVKGGALALGAATLASSRAAGANERVRAAFIGTANRGGQLIERTLPFTDVEIVAVCDVYEPARRKWAEKIGGDVAQYNDFREVLDRKDIDAVFIATPDHWHGLQTVMACEAGKDVYCEKPTSMTVVEGRKMIEAARRHERVVTVGVQRRASQMYAELRELIANDTVGKITVARACRINNMWPKGIGRAPDSDPPPGLDWDLWLGPRPMRPFNENIAPYKFRWWKLYSSQMANWGVHYFDLLRWLMGEEAPSAVYATGGQFAVDDDRTIPDTMHAVFEFASGAHLLFAQYEASGYTMFPQGAEFELRGTKGIIYGGSRGVTIIPEKGGQFQTWGKLTEDRELKPEGDTDPTGDLIRDFIDCVRSRQRPKADIEEGHKSNIFALIGNISLEVKARLEWDTATERFTNNDAANALLHYEYREPWKLG